MKCVKPQILQITSMYALGKGLTMFGTVIQGTMGLMKEEKQELKQVLIHKL